MHVIESGQPVEIFSGACSVFDTSKARMIEISYAYVTENILWFEDNDQVKTELKKYLSSIEELVEALSIAFWKNACEPLPKFSEVELICLRVFYSQV